MGSNPTLSARLCSFAALGASADHPFPPDRLATRVSCLDGYRDRDRAYHELGEATKRSILGMLPEAWTFDDKRVLDFGCGAGRTLRHFLEEANHAEIWGADLDAESIDWLRRNLSPPLRTVVSSEEPPLRGGPEPGSLDLAWAVSVFTHLADNSIPWLLELHRLLKPGGLLVATYMGKGMSEEVAREPWEEDRVGMNVLRHDQGWGVGGPMVLMSEWWMREHWGRAFDVLKVKEKPRGQSWVLLRKRDVAPTVEELERPSSDPREHAAVKHNLQQLRSEIEAREREVRQSRSWKLTRPLRDGAHALRAVRAKRRRR